MQDNNQHELDPQFVEHAWQQMKSMLDDEMPARPVLIPWWRRLGILFLLLFVATGLVGFSIYYFNQSTGIESPTTPVKTPLSEQSPVAVLEEELCPPETSEIVKTTEATSPIAKVTANPVWSEKTKEPSTEPNFSSPSISGKEPVANLLVLTNSISPLQAKSFGVVSTKDANQSFIPESESLIQPLENSGVSFRMGAGLGVLAGLSPFQAVGMNAGIPMELQFTKSRWSLLTAPAYELSRLNYQSREQVVMTKADRFDEMEGLFNTIEDTVLAEVTARYGESSLNYTLHSFYLPLEAGFRISRKFRVEMGAGVNVLLSSNQTRNGILDLASSKADFSPSPVASNSADLSVSLPEVRQAIMSGTLGISYLPTDRLGVHLKYRHDFSGLFPESSKPNAHRIHLGMSYMFR